MEKRFNLLRYKELIKLTESGKYSLFDEIYIEFLTYRVSVKNQICYNRKENYFSLIEKYLTGLIELDQFRSKFLEMEDQDTETADRILNDFRELEVLRLADDLEEFSDLIIKISELCFNYYEVDLGPMSENEFFNLVNNYYLQFQKH